MRPSRFRPLAFAVLILAACGDDDGATTPDAAVDAAPDPRFTAIAQAVEDDLVSSEATAASVAVWLEGEIVWVGGFGTLDPDGRAPGPDTLFMIGSDTKKLTAVSLLRRVEAGQATLDTTVGEVVPELAMMYAPDFAGATIRDLLSHQGGLVDGVEVSSTTADEDLLGFVLGEFADTYYQMAPPGRIWNYCNPNFSIAGLLDQRLDGRMWPDIVEEDLFAPLGMRRTVARKGEVDEDHAPGMGLSSAVPDDATLGPVPLAELWESAFVRPAGLVWSTPGDQMRVAAFLVDGDPAILSADLLQEVVSPQVALYPDFGGGYGFGLMIDRGLSLGTTWYDVPIWHHGGNTLTHTSTFYILPDQRFAISILSNGMGDDFIGTVVAAITSLVDLPAPGTPPELPFDPAGLDALTGTYVDENNVGELIVTRAGDALAVSAPALDELGIPYQHALAPLTTRVWLATIQGEQLDVAFIDGPDGETYLRNRIFVAIRPGPLTKPLRAARPTRQALQRTLDAARRDRLPLLVPRRP